MSRYRNMFETLGKRGEAAFGGFLMLGDPDPATCADLLDALVAGGADMVEVGIPFSDPVADGPIIQAAAVRALSSGVRVDECFRLIGEFRSRHADIPVGILTYANIVAARGVDRFLSDAVAAGVDSLLIADVPSLEIEPFAAAGSAAGIDVVMIAAPNTPGQTLTRIARMCEGYTYCVARAGVTGERDELALHQHRQLFDALRGLGAPPAVLGFGISTPDQVRQAVAAGADGVISGSAIVRLAHEQGIEKVREFVAEMKAATRVNMIDQSQRV